MYKYLIVIALTATLFSCAERSEYAPIIEEWSGSPKFSGINIEYPFDGAVFPPEIPAPTLKWSDSSSASKWIVFLETYGKRTHISQISTNKELKIDSAAWASIKSKSFGSGVRAAILGLSEDERKIISAASVSFKISKDSVGAPIFYRTVTLPFSFAVDNLETISWRLGSVGSSEKPRVVLENLPVCGNCHSFSSDGKVIGMDVDYGSDKGSYFIDEIKSEIELTPAKIITWSDYKREDGEKTFGLLSKVSPCGRYVLSTVKDRSVFVRKEDLEYSQLFFPIKGILAVYDRKTGEYSALPGAENPNYCQSCPEWSPNGETILFARAPYYKLPEIEASREVILPTKLALDFIEGRKNYRYKIYSLPFNGGAGGVAKPLVGASNDGESAFFPKYSPDGKWIVLTKADNFMLLQPDAKLYILPAQGGKPRLMNCNLPSMNSWHSWSPNGKWLVFSSKMFGPYTQLFLTHIDENGIDSPPVLLENFSFRERAANIPEFVNISENGLQKIVEKFITSENYARDIGQNMLEEGDPHKALEELTRAIEKNPYDHASYNLRGVALSEMGDLEGALADFSKVIELRPHRYDVYANRGNIFMKMRKFRLAIADYDKSISVNDKDGHVFFKRAEAYYNLEQFDKAIADFDQSLRLKPDNAKCYFERALAKLSLGKMDSACEDLRTAASFGENQALQFIEKYCRNN